MTRTVRVLRIALPLLFVAFLIVVVTSFTGNERRDPVGDDVATGLRRQERPQRIGDKFALTQTVGGRTVLRILADRTVGFESGWYTLEGVRLTVFRTGGRTYEIEAAQAQVHQDTRELEAVGGVTVRSGDGMMVRTEELRFDGSRLLGENPLTFRMRTWEGKAGGMRLDVTAETVQLVNGVEGQTPAAEGNPPMSFRSGQADFLRGSAELQMSGGVVIHRGEDRFTSSSAFARMDPETDHLRAIRGEDRASVFLPRGASGNAAASGAITVGGDRFDGEFDDAGRLVAIQASGGPARADLAGPPSRTLVAPTFRLLMPGGSLREIQATGGVQLTESHPEGVRRLNAQMASAAVSPSTGGVVSVQTSGNVRFTDGRISGEGDRAMWDLTLRRMIITSDPPRLPTLRTATEAMRARRLEVELDSSTLTAHEQVYASLQSAGGGEGAMFEARTPVLVNADNAVLRQKDGLAVFRGNVRAWQGDDTLFAAELRVAQGQGTLTASGGVRTQLHDRSGRATAPIRTVSDSLTARRTDNRIELDGNVQVEESGRIVNADKAIVLVAEGGGGLQRVEGTGSVRMREVATGREGSGSHTVYDPGSKTIVLDGEPARISDAQGEVRGRQILFDLARNRVEVISVGSEPTEATYNPPSR